MWPRTFWGKDEHLWRICESTGLNRLGKCWVRHGRESTGLNIAEKVLGQTWLTRYSTKHDSGNIGLNMGEDIKRSKGVRAQLATRGKVSGGGGMCFECPGSDLITWYMLLSGHNP